MKAALKYRIHRTIAIIVVPLLLLSTLTGFFRANQKWFWPEGYKKKKQPADFVLQSELVSVNAITTKIDSISGKKNKYKDINLRADNNRLFYVVTTTIDKYLLDAYTGELVSPLSPQLASAIALQYVQEQPAVKSCTLLKEYAPRKAKEKKPAYEVRFDNALHSHIYLDYRTGEIIEDIDDNRSFGMWVARLHDYDFFNSKRGITNIVSAGILLVALSGIWIYRFRSKKKLKETGSGSLH